MPNGGYPICAGCWFNRQNQGEDGWRSKGVLSGWFWHPNNPRKEPPEAFCEIRGVKLTGTGGHPVCANHPVFRIDRDPIPIGPLWQSFSGPPAEGVGVLVAPSPDTDRIRLHLLHLLEEMFTSGEMPAEHQFPGYVHLGRTIIRQLAEFRELRAIPLLKQIAELDREPQSGSEDTAGSDAAISHWHLANYARQALRSLEE